MIFPMITGGAYEERTSTGNHGGKKVEMIFPTITGGAYDERTSAGNHGGKKVEMFCPRLPVAHTMNGPHRIYCMVIHVYTR